LKDGINKNFELTQQTIDKVLDKVYVTPINETDCVLNIVLKLKHQIEYKYNKSGQIARNKGNELYLIEKRSDQFSKLNCSKRLYSFDRIDLFKKRTFKVNYTSYLAV
jgi:hypothetical protein